MDLGVNAKLGNFETSTFGLFLVVVATVVVTVCRLLLNQLLQKDLCVVDCGLVVTDDSVGDDLVLLVGLIAGKAVVFAFQLKLKNGKE